VRAVRAAEYTAVGEGARGGDVRGGGERVVKRGGGEEGGRGEDAAERNEGGGGEGGGRSEEAVVVVVVAVVVVAVVDQLFQSRAATKSNISSTSSLGTSNRAKNKMKIFNLFS
jgi:hypothetical protein